MDPAASLACPHTQAQRYTLTGVNSNPGYKDDPVRTAGGCWESLQTQMLQHPMTNTASVMCYNENVGSKKHIRSDALWDFSSSEEG